MKIAIIGAGMAGLGAARTLVAHGHDVVLFDKGASVGGRVGTRRIEHNGETVFFDHGAQNVKSQGASLENELQQNAFDNRVFIPQPVCLRHENRVLEGDAKANAEPKWTMRGGLRNLPHMLSHGLDVRCNTRVVRLEETPDSITLFDGSNRVLEVADRVIVTCPVPQTVDLIECSNLIGESSQRIERLRGVEYSRCLSVLMVFDFSIDLDWYALLAKNREEPLLWLANENAKSGFVPDGATALVAQIGDAKSIELWHDSDQEIVRHTLGWLQQVEKKLDSPSKSFVKRWRYSQPKNSVSFDDVNAPEDRVLVCGDGITNGITNGVINEVAKGRVTAAWDSGVQVAQWIVL